MSPCDGLGLLYPARWSRLRVAAPCVSLVLLLHPPIADRTPDQQSNPDSHAQQLMTAATMSTHRPPISDRRSGSGMPFRLACAVRSLRVRLEETGLVREHDRLHTVAEVELLEDVRDVRLHGPLADEELLADFRV